ncbi:DUF4328 domain-containing protein [Pseudonocardia hydrocarbonoxydans]|uniref:DUF4328 domain-containing protein n=1 Tax=Pseudonocardia hydrocarbonoxydans TaxID=76726 RepID=A0A4Y3WWB9_9PSEU|nr:DUF4328 domain-containing protein [Pseudonocardia hydrocarbonoxydans]GEC22029.1 hypothetical protein PHY01_43120 [Pseudonocardia hydrocarbonoxydans]
MPPGTQTCPRCRRTSSPEAGPFCPYCGRYLAALEWVAHPPAPDEPPAVPAPRRPYTGPPRYRLRPTGGYPALPWVRTSGPDAPGPLHAARSVAGTVVPLLWATAAVALVAAGSEAWRYGLLLASRSDALSAQVVAASDALVISAGTIAPILTVFAGALVVLWSVRAAAAAAHGAGVVASRRPRDVVLGWVVPGVNLAVPGSVLAEIEHTALGRPAGERPRPSRLLLVWWALWAAGIVLSAVVLLWGLRTGVQARADGVVLHGVLDLLAAVVAGVTAVLVTHLTRLLAPARADRRELLVAVRS